jgi:transcriptional regulator with XRE-family HTH domain
MSTQLQSSFGERVRALRASSGASQEGFAQAANIDRATYGKIERGELNPSLLTMARLAIALQISLSELLKDVTLSATEIKAMPRSARGRPRK